MIGDFPQLPMEAPELPGEIKPVSLVIEMPRIDGSPIVSEAEGRIMRLDNGDVLMVAVETGERGVIVSRIRKAITTAAPIGLALALLGGYFISRYAAARADTLARTAEAVMAGDLSRRAPVRASGDEFDRLGERLNAMLDRIERLMAAGRHTGDAIAHDLRSPLSRLRNRLEAALLEPMSAEDARETMGQTVEEVDRVLSTFNAILRLSRLDAGAEGRLVFLEMHDVCEELAELFEPACEAAGLSFSSTIGRNMHVLGDRDLLAQAVANLLDNAVKYTPEGGSIRFELKRTDTDVVISVTDSGPGIPEHQREKAKERFFRLDSARTQSGSGLGLALVDAVAELHKGSFDLLAGYGPQERPGLRAVLSLPREK